MFLYHSTMTGEEIKDAIQQFKIEAYGDEADHVAEYDPSTINTPDAGELKDENKLSEIVEKTGGKRNDNKDMATFVFSNIVQNGATLITINQPDSLIEQVHEDMGADQIEGYFETVKDEMGDVEFVLFVRNFDAPED